MNRTVTYIIKQIDGGPQYRVYSKQVAEKLKNKLENKFGKIFIIEESMCYKKKRE